MTPDKHPQPSQPGVPYVAKGNNHPHLPTHVTAMPLEPGETMEVNAMSAQLKWQTKGAALNIPVKTARAGQQCGVSKEQALQAWVHRLLFLRREELAVTADSPP